jgi:hypothetical protein
MIDINSPEFKKELKKLIEESLDSYKLGVLREIFLTKDEFKEEMDKLHKDQEKHQQNIEKNQQRIEKNQQNIEKNQQNIEKNQQNIENIKQENNKIWQEIQDLKKETTKIWQNIEKRQQNIEKNQLNIEKNQQNIEQQRKKSENHFKRLEIAILVLQGKMGPELESLILDVMRETLLMENIDPDKISKKILIDKEGKVYRSDYSTDIDVLIENNNTYLIEVKATADNRDVIDLLDKAELYQLLTGREPTKLYMVALRMKQKNYDYAINKNISVILGEIF